MSKNTTSSQKNTAETELPCEICGTPTPYVDDDMVVICNSCIYDNLDRDDDAQD